jgi:SSS family transporter
MSGFTMVDIAIVIVYMLLSTGLGAYIGRNQKSANDYFLGGRSIPWYAVMFSIVATETSVLTFIGVPAVSYLGDMTFLQLVIGYIIGRGLVAVILIPAYYRGKLTTAYHFLGTRFGQRMRNTASVTFMLTRLLADGIRLFATAIPLAIIIKSSGIFAGMSNTEFYALSIILVGILTIIYTYIGGIRSVIWMDMIQWIIYMGGAVLACWLMLSKFPNGFSDVLTAGEVQNKFRWFYSGFDLSFSAFIRNAYTFCTAVVGGAIFSLASHGTDQLIVQRVLTCKTEADSKKAMIGSGITVFFQFLVFLIIGVMLFAFYQGASVQELGLSRADGIFPKFIVEEMPAGISGLIVAALFAAAMSTLSSSLSSLSSAAVLDIYLPLFGKDKTETQLLSVSRLATIIWGIILVGAAILFIGLEGTVVEVALGIASYTYGGLLGTFLLGLLFQNADETDAILGFIAAIITMALMIQTIQIAWPLYTLIGSLTTIIVGFTFHFLRGGNSHAS